MVGKLPHRIPKLVSRSLFLLNKICVKDFILYIRYPEPIPSGVFVPGWAYLDVQVLKIFQFIDIEESIDR